MPRTWRAAWRVDQRTDWWLSWPRAARGKGTACVSCHGTTDAKLGTPWLDGQSGVYLKAQLRAFATGDRRNDISEQMRNVARHMTALEIDDAARYYASRP